MAEPSFAAGLVGVVLDERYRLDALLGEGGMGAVYRATHLAMDRRVAVKLLKPHLTADETQLQRFAREARSTLKVDSPHAVKVLDFGVTPHRDYYMVLEYLDGRTVQRELDVDGPFTPARAVHVVRQVLQALGAAHRSGLVHRDIKPDNVLLLRVGADPDYAKVLDFGVAKLMQGAARSSQSALALTQMGMVFGTPEFMSPEQACGHPLDGRSDLYSVAATLFAMLTGCGLFEGDSPLEWLTHHARTPPPRLGMVQPELAAYVELDDLLQRCLAKQRDQRPRTAEEMDGLLAGIVPTLSRAGKATPAAGAAARANPLSSSSYFDALPAATVDPGATLLPPSGAASRPSGELSAPSGPITANERPAAHRPGVASPSDIGTTSIRPIQHGRRRGLILAIVAIAVVAMVGVAIGIALTRRGGSRTASVPRDAAVMALAPVIDAGTPAPPIDGPEPIVDAAPPVAPAPDAATSRPPPVIKRAGLEEHLRAAEEARRASNHLKQLAEADLALQADARNQAARYLFGDALIKNGHIDKGCKYLRPLKRNPKAQDVANAAGCPAD